MFIEIAEDDWIDPNAVDRVRFVRKDIIGRPLVKPYVQIVLSCGDRIAMPPEIQLESVLETLGEAGEREWNFNEYTTPAPFTGDNQG